MDSTKLDEAILAFREDPTSERQAAVMDAQRDYVRGVFARDAGEYIDRTKRGAKKEAS